MTDISPRQTGDMLIHFARMSRDACRQRRADQLRSLILALAMVAAAALSGWLLGAAQATVTALPGIVAQSQACAAW
ncbi:MAG: hypothetical protein ACOH2H_16030 [Cypionkella sp.]